MARRENTYHVVLPTINGSLVGPPTTCDTPQAAQDVVEESRANDPYGWYAEYEIRPMTPSELAFLLAA